MLRVSIMLRRMLGGVAVGLVGVLSGQPDLGGWRTRLPRRRDAEICRLHLRSLWGSWRGRLVDRAGEDGLSLWLFGLQVYVSRHEGRTDVQLPNGLVVRGEVVRRGSVDLFTPVLPEFRETPLVLVPSHRRR